MFFQSWYQNLKNCGNRLDGAKLLHHFSPAPGVLFSFVMYVNIWVESEKRNKSNEFIFIDQVFALFSLIIKITTTRISLWLKNLEAQLIIKQVVHGNFQEEVQ